MGLVLDWDKFGFNLTPTKTMFVAKSTPDMSWPEGNFVPYGDIPISPAAGVLNYGQGIFEGMKALRTQKNEIVLFRPTSNAKRFAEGADRLCMPVVPTSYFVSAIKRVVYENRDYIPPYKKGSLYIRPCLWGTGAVLGIAPAPEYTFLIYTSPVGAYYKSGLKTIKILISDAYHRAASKGTGHVKAIGNYAGTLAFLQQAKAQGFQGCLYLDSNHSKYIEEVGSANFFCVIDNKLYTPKLGSILPGITRDSVIRIARELLNIEVIEKDISVEEVVAATECFCVGTAAVITPIGSLTYMQKETIYNNNEIGLLTQQIYNILTGIQLAELPDPFGWVKTVSQADWAAKPLFM